MSLKIVTVSDSHGNTDLLRRVINDCSPFDLIIHCGDGLRDISGADIPGCSSVMKVAGNTDLHFCCDADEILTEEILEKKVMITHGHQFNVKTGLKDLLLYAERIDADVVIFGHTHSQFIQKGVPLLFNPGDLSAGCYGIIHASKNEDWRFEHKKIKRG